MKICYTKERERVLKQTYDQCYYLSSFLNSGRSFLVNRQESKKPHYPFNMFRHRMTRCTLHFRFHLSADWEELWYEHSVPQLRVISPAEGSKNVSYPWLSPLQGRVVFLHRSVHHVLKCMSCHKAIVVTTGRTHFFMIPYILRPSCFGRV